MNRTRWLIAAIAGCAMVTLVLLLAALVIADKAHFGWMVGSQFLQVTTSMIFVGALILLVAAWKLHELHNWRGRTLLLWALITLASPLAGYLFLLPWLVLALTLPVVIAALITLWRERGIATPPPR